MASWGIKTTSDQDPARSLGPRQPPSCHEALLYIFLIIPRCPWTTCQVLRPQPSSLQTRYPTPPGDAELTRDPFAAQAYMRHSALFLLLFKQGVQQHSSRSRLLTDNFSLNQKRTIILDRYCHVGEFCASD